MKRLVAILFLVVSVALNAQTKSDSVNVVQNWAKWYDLDFTSSEADSMLNNLVFWKQIYVRMHQRLPKNDLAYPFAFNPHRWVQRFQTTNRRLIGRFLPQLLCPQIKMILLFIPFSNWHH
jgi:hypothetical protein